MRAIRSTSNASTEWRFRGLVVKNAIKGWKLHEASVLGTPDFFFANQRVAVFVDQCFWHGCPNCGHVPKANSLYWMKKLARNKRRDSLNSEESKVQRHKSYPHLGVRTARPATHLPYEVVACS